MEDLLYKNIFIDSDLTKLSPDYSPSGFILRMQMRRSSVKDTHRHGIKKNQCFQRRNGQRKVTNEMMKMGKEITKLKNGYVIDNLKNKVSFEKYIDKSNIIRSNKSHEKSLHTEIVNKTIEQINTSFNEDNIDKQTTSNETLDGVIYETFTETPTSNELNKIKKVNKPQIKNSLFKKKHLKSEIKLKDLHKKVNVMIVKSKKIHNEILDYNEYMYKTDDKNKQTDNDYNHNPNENSDISSNVINNINPVDDLQTILINMAISGEIKEDDINEDKCNEQSTTHPTSLVVSPIKNADTLNFLNIVPLRTGTYYKQEYLIKKYVKKWRHHIKYKKENNFQFRKKALDTFFDKLTQKKVEMKKDTADANTNKAKLLVRDYNTYQHRYKVQKHIIALQKAKLEEQNKIIENLKYNKIVDASKQSIEAMREEVRKTYYEIDKHLKPKIKCLSNELKLHDLEEPTLVLHCLKVPQFLQRMEKRAREREEKHALIRERRQQMEEERIRLKQQAELAKAEMDKEERMRIIKELKQRRKREKIESIRKKQYTERMRALKVMADLHYERNVIMRYGIRAFKKLIEIKRNNAERAKSHYVFQLKKNVFLNWMWYTEDMWFDRNFRAEDFNRKKIMRKAFAAFKQNHHKYVLKKQVAEDYYELYLVQIVFRKFLEAIELIRQDNEKRMQVAAAYYNSNLSFKLFIHWRSLPALNALEREQEARKAKWRQKVLQVVPDYTPPED